MLIDYSKKIIKNILLSTIGLGEKQKILLLSLLLREKYRSALSKRDKNRYGENNLPTLYQ